MRKFLFLFFVIIFLLVCNFSCENFSPGEISVPGKFYVPTITQTQESSSIYSTGFVQIDGCWNVRERPDFTSRIIRVQCGGRVSPVSQVGGYYFIGDGYMCGRAWGEEVLCGND